MREREMNEGAALPQRKRQRRTRKHSRNELADEKSRGRFAAIDAAIRKRTEANKRRLESAKPDPGKVHTDELAVEAVASDASAVENLPVAGYEHLGTTADVQIHSWGPSLSVAFEKCVLGLFAIKTDLSKVQESSASEPICSFEVCGRDVKSLLFALLEGEE